MKNPIRKQTQVLLDVVLIYDENDKELAEDTLACALYALDNEMFEIKNIRKVE